MSYLARVDLGAAEGVLVDTHVGGTDEVVLGEMGWWSYFVVLEQSHKLRCACQALKSVSYFDWLVRQKSRDLYNFKGLHNFLYSDKHYNWYQ